MISRRPSERPILGAALTPVYIAGQDDQVDLSIGVNGAPVSDANPMPVSGDVNVTDRIGRLVGRMSNYDVLSNGTLAALNEVVTIDASGLSTIGVGISGAGWNMTITVEGNIGDGVWHILPMIDALTGAATVSTAVNGAWHVGVAGYLSVRIHAFAWVAGTATIYIEGTSATAGVFLSRSIPTGINNIGTVGLVAGTATVGSFRAASTSIIQTPAVTAGLYAANDNVGGLLTFANAARTAAGGGIIKGMTIIDDASQSAELELWLFNQTFTAGADDAPWTPVEAELHNLVAIISTADGTYYTGGATATICDAEVARRYGCAATSLFGRLVTRTAMTPVAVDDVSVILHLLQD